MIRHKEFLKDNVKFLKIFYVLVVIYCQLCGRSTRGYYLDYGKIGEQQLSSLWPELNVPNAYTGQFYQTHIASTNLTDHHIRFLVSQVGSDDLPIWLTFENGNYSLTGIPLASDIGLHPLFVLAMKCNETTTVGDLLGAQTFEINVLPSENRSYCDGGVNFVATEVSLAVNGTHLNSTQRLELYYWFVTEFDLSDRTSFVYFKHELKHEQWNGTGCEVLERYNANSSYSGPVLTISWLVGCDLTNASDGVSQKLSEVILGYPVASWRILNGNDSRTCFPGIHISTSVSSVNLVIRKSTAVSSIQPSMPIQRSSPFVEQLQSSSIIPSTVLLVKPTSLMTLNLSRQHNSTVVSPTIKLMSHPSIIFNKTFTSSLLEGKSDVTTKHTVVTTFHMALVTSRLDTVGNSQYATTYSRSELISLISTTKSGNVPATSQSITLNQNTDPVVQRPLPTLNISSCQYLYYKIPQDTFWDKEDGNNLTLRVFTNNFHQLPSESWIKLDTTHDVIYGIPVSSQLFGKNVTTVNLEYILSAVDSAGRAVNTSLTLTVYDDIAQIGQRISIEVESQSVSFNLLQLIQDISEYLYDGDKSTMKILSLNETSAKIYLTWSDCKAVSDVCDISRVKRTSQLIRIDESFLNPHFVVALVPHFVLLNARVETLDMCLNEPPVAREMSIHLNITCCGKFRYVIPRDLFYDQEDGDVRNLSLSIRFSSASRLHSERWVMLNNTSKSIEGVIILEEVQKQPDFDAFFLVAQDSGRLEANVSVIITVQHPLPVTNYFVSLFLMRLQSFSTSVQEVFTIIEKLTWYFDRESSDEIRVLSYSRENAVTIFKWSLADLRFKPCDVAAITNISKKLKAANGQVNDDFQLIMSPEFKIQFIFEERVGHCKEGANEQPTAVIPIHRLRLNLTYFEYKIPASTFSDLEDGNTRNLRLSFLLPAFESLPVGSWITLNSGTQVIYGLPDNDAIQAQPVGGYRYLLVGQDSGGEFATASVVVQLPETSHRYNYKFTAYLRSYLDASLPCVDHAIEFLEKLSTFTGDDKESIRILSYNVSKNYPADVTISWTNHSASFNTCDHGVINKKFREFAGDETGVSRSFSEIFLPYFIVLNVELQFLETCNVFPNTPPILVSPVETLNVPLYQVWRFQLPPTMFYDAEDGNTRNLTIVVLDNDNKPLNFSSWIQFNSTTQFLYGLPSSAVAKEQPIGGYVIQIVAMDTNSNTVNSTTRIIVDDTKTAVSYVVRIIMTVNTSLEHSDTDMVLHFLASITSFLGNSDTIITDYFKNNIGLKVVVSTLKFLASECDFVELAEIRHQLFQKVENASTVVEGTGNASYTVQPSENFTRAMFPDFLISSVTEHRRGPCSNTAPYVLHPIPHIIISTPGLFSIVLPPNTFYDKEDGFTFNLSLILLSSSGHVLPPNTWLQFNDTTDQIDGFITEEIRRNENYSFVLRAEDSYGLKVNTSFTIEVTSRLQNVGFKLNMIFRSNFSSIVSHVEIIKLLVDKITNYYYNNLTLNVLSFERGAGVPSTDILSWSVKELDSENCDLEKLHEISRKARFSNNEPHEEFRHALLPEFEVLVVFEQRLGSCADTLNTLPTVLVPILNLTVTRIPTVFHYVVPRNVFNDPEDGDTRNLTLTLLDEDNRDIPRNSSVQFNPALQMVYGIFTESDLNTNSRIVKRNIESSSIIIKFVLLAMDSGGKTARSLLEINLRNNIISQNYELHLTFISYLSSTSPDVIHLINFQEKLRGFEALRDMQVANYVRFQGYPAKFDVSFINSSSTFNQSVCDFNEISKATESVQDSSSDLKSEFTVRFLPEFVIQESYIRREGSCENLPNYPPRVNGGIPAISITVCEILKYQIPEDLFLDEDGNTRNLSLSLEVVLPQGHNLDWLFFEEHSQIVYAVPSLKVVDNQPKDGYIFRLTATDSQGNKAEVNFNVIVRDTVVRDSYRVSVLVRVPSLIKTKDDFVFKTFEFVEATKRYLSSSSRDEVRVINVTKMTQSLLKVTWSNCSLRYTPCDYQSIEEIRQATIHTGTLPQPRFIQSLAPAFIVDSVEDEMRGSCLNQRPVVRRELEALHVKLCDGLFQYTIPDNTFFDAEDGYTPNLTLSVLNSNFVPLSENYWLTIDQSQTIIAYPNIDALKLQPESGYEFLINAKDSYGLSTNLAINISYEGERSLQSSYEVTFVLHTQFANITNSVDHMQIILQTLASYMGGSEKAIRVHSFARAGANSTTSFFTWSNCSFLSNGCDLLGIMEISKRLKNPDGQISEQLRQAFRPHFELEFVFEQRLGVCIGETNVRPEGKQALYQLTVENFCGIWQFHIPSDFFFDAEDGGTRNLTLSLKTSDSLEVAADLWIQLDQESQTLFGFPIFSNSSNSSAPTNEMFILIAADSQGKLATMKLEIIFNKKIPNVHYGVFVKMLSYVGESLPDVYHLKQFVESIVLFLKAETGSIMVTNYERTTTGTSSELRVTWTNCSLTVNTCDSNQISILREKLHLSNGVVDTEFSQSMLPYFVPNFISLEKFGLCRIEAIKSPPRLVRPIGRIVAYSGSFLRYLIPDDIFIDEEDGNVLNLSLVFEFSNKNPVPSSYWLSFDKTNLLISGVLLVENSWKRSFRLVAHDQHGNEAVDTFDVFLERRCPKNLLSYQVFTEFVYTGNKESLNTEFLKKLEVYFHPWFSDTNFTLLSRSTESNNTFLIVWSHAKTCGACLNVNNTLQALSDNITDSNGTALPEFRTALLPEFKLVNISEQKCSPPLGIPITITKGGKDDRWKLYVVPIVVLLIFLLFSFVFFICRCLLFPYESKKVEVMLDESPVLSREIHVTERIRASEASMYNSASTTIINEGFVANNDAIALPEIFLDKRISPSKPSLKQDLSPGSAQDVEPTVVPTPPLYTDAVLLLAADSDRKPGESESPSTTRRERPIEMHELPITKSEVELSSEAIPISEKLEVDGRHSPSRSKEKIQSIRSSPLYSIPDDDPFAYEEDPTPVRNRLRLPTPPEVGMLRLPPVPKPLNNSLSSPLGNSPASPFGGNTPNSPSAYSTPLQTPSYSKTTVNNTYNVSRIHSTPEISPNNYPYPPPYSQYPYGTPMRERTELGIQSPISYAAPMRERAQLGIQSPIGFPFPQGRVPYVDHRQQGPQSAPQSRPSDLHEVLGQLRETVNRELDRRNEVDKYLDSYLNKK